MYRHILLATDGSPASQRACALGIGIAQWVGARVTALLATSTFRSSEIHAHAILREAREHEEHARSEASKVLDPIVRDAKAAGVACVSMHAVSDRPWQTILDTARNQGCDLIVLGSHGPHGLRGLLMGSQVDRILIQSRIAVLVAP
jgi:nucleotide-binding universal stress UspA family protein